VERKSFPIMTLPTSEPITKEEQEEGIIASADGEKLRFCADCSHLLGVRYRTEEPENWKCVHPENLIKNEKVWNLVTGIQEYIREYKQSDIFKLRSDSQLCGPKGSWWEKYEKPEYKKEPTIGGKEATALTEEVFNKEELDANAQAAKERIAEMRKKKLGL
jgi:hypothetical protein